jgi:hypothetical protein
VDEGADALRQVSIDWTGRTILLLDVCVVSNHRYVACTYHSRHGAAVTMVLFAFGHGHAHRERERLNANAQKDKHKPKKQHFWNSNKHTPESILSFFCFPLFKKTLRCLSPRKQADWFCVQASTSTKSLLKNDTSCPTPTPLRLKHLETTVS